MAPYEPDSEFYRWGISIFTPSHNLLFPGGTTELDSSYGNYYFREDVSGSGNKDEYLQGSIFPQYTFGACTRDYSVVIEDGQEERNDSEPSSFNALSLGTPVEFSVEDGKLERRLNHMVALPHVPRINGEIPSADDATSDHQRLLDRLKLYELVECKVQGDGNCQFRSLSDQLYRTPEHHVFVRQQVVEQLRSHRQNYEGYVPMAYNDYLNKLSKTGEWGDHVTLQAAADSYGIKIFVITSFKDTCYIEILPSVEKSKRVIFLSFWAEVHYNSIYPEEDLPAAADTKEKKKWWQFGK